MRIFAHLRPILLQNRSNMMKFLCVYTISGALKSQKIEEEIRGVILTNDTFADRVSNVSAATTLTKEIESQQRLICFEARNLEL